MNSNKRLKDTKTIVREIFEAHSDWNAKQIYDRYLILIGDTNKAVTLNAVQKHVEEFKDIANRPEYQDLERLWQLGTIVDYPQYHIPPEAIEFILSVQWLIRTHKDPILKGFTYEPLTIREALWVSRLFSFISEKEMNDKKRRISVLDWLYNWAKTYATQERLCKLAHIPTDTTDLDIALSQGLITRSNGSQWFTANYKTREIKLDPLTAKKLMESISKQESEK